MPRSGSVIVFLSMVLLLAAFTACASAGKQETPAVMTGTVEFLDIEGGCWIIRTDDGKTLSPINLPRSAWKHGLRVSFTASAESGMITSCMAGEPVRILSIEPLQEQNNR